MPAEGVAPPFLVRRFDPTHDFPALVCLINAIDAVDHSGEATTEDQQREQLAWPGRDLLRDRWVATAAQQDDQLIGYGDSWKMPTTPTADIYVGVHPDWRRRGLGRELLRRTLVRASEQAATHVAVYADATNPAAHPFLHNHGFQVAGAFVELHASMPYAIEAPHWPPGYTLRRFSQIANLPGLVDVLNRSYGDRFGHKLTTETDIQGWSEPETAANILLLADADEALVGICRVRPASNVHANQDHSIGYLDAPGVVPTHRQSSLYRSLVLAGMERLRQQGQTAIVLESWGDEERTIAGYCELGFTRQRHSLAYRRSVV
ncbi:MAG: GNAT family N-acetyltransferase [Roseiflexaceae bacterium]|nr:GNAT family N-acetyltransferase [Roseiflexaceae bacterium]